MAKRTGLGKGLGAIFGDEVMESAAEEQEAKHQAKSKSAQEQEKKEEENDIGKELMVKVTAIEPNREQPRKDFNEEAMEELAESMKVYGVLQPLLVQKKGDYYEIIAGERRWRAAKLAGLKEVPVVIREYTKQQTMEIALIENVQREDLNPIEEAKAYQRLIQEFELKQEEIAARVGKNRVTITNSMRLLKLDERVQDLLIQNQITGGHARALLSVEDGQLQYELSGKIIAENLSVRETEKLVKSLSKKKNPKEKKVEDESLTLIFRDLEERMKSAMGTKVSINRKDKNKGRVEIEYYSESELERIVELIESIR
ncbi:MAG: ParB/RepB/Spo0J family partition protein [Hungatella hathewayi]|uniref:ParB/RepB/Spo0J family partition protein n=1 Tax=Hungatella TaxID=1649459 RepID=UPI001106F91F|nr:MULTISPECIES: ParB/RepB/Spo0J family partition protein [Hungatella]MCI7380293.1 ParB/RepB/Spo0J family partition protein [Hungatella sp.]MDY6236735.1 ParB/RepB/Spo0J family partition protein [Hungatella hathewayi]